MTRAEKIEVTARAVATCGSLVPESPRACEVMEALRKALASSDRDDLPVNLPVIRTCGGCPAIGSTAERFGFDGEEYGSADVCGMDSDLRTVERNSAPPAWCPLRSAL